MRSSKEKALFRGLAVVIATALLLAGCNNSSPTEPRFVGPAPTPIAWAWTGTYNGVSSRCASSAQMDFEQTGSAIKGIMLVPCVQKYAVQFDGDLQGTTFTGLAMWGDPEFYPLKGSLSGSSLELTIFNELGSGQSGTPMGQLHLHR